MENENMRKLKKCLLLFGCACMMLMTSGCSGSAFDADQYVKGVLDNVYLGDSTLYQKYVDVSEADALKEYEKGIRTEVEMLLEAYAIEDAGEATYQKFEDFYKEVYKKAKYEVKESEANDKGFTVEVEIYPIDVIKNAKDELETAFDEFLETTKAEDFKDSSEESDAIGEKLLEVLNKHKDSLGYGEAQTVTVTVSQDKDDLWGFSDDDFAKLDQYIIAYE